MFKNFTMLIIGGDARYLEVIEKLSSDGATVFLIGFDQIPVPGTRIIKSNMDDMDFSCIDAILLPIAGTELDGNVETPFSHENVYLTKDMLTKTPEHCVVYTGTTNPFLNHAVKSAKRKLVSLYARDDIAILNSIPTAEGTLQLAMEQTETTIHGSHVMVLGFGRVGMTVARLFAAAGADVSVCVRKTADVARGTEMGLTPVLIKNLQKCMDDVDIAINTIPHQILDKDVISTMKKTALIIDLASKPGGTDFSFAVETGVKAIHALGLPGKVAPKSAGRIMANVLEDLLVEQ